MRTRLTLTLAAISFAASSVAASANAGDENQSRAAVIQIGLPRRVPTALDSVQHPWPGIALVLTTTGVVAPIAFEESVRKQNAGAGPFFALLGAEILTPAAGHLYAGLGRRAAIGIGVRAVGVGIAAAGATASDLWHEGSPSDIMPSILVFVLGVGIVAADAAWDVITVPTDVERRNSEWLRAHATVGVRPLPSGRGPALALTLRY